MDWRPIDTAPKDGTRVLITWSGVVEEGYWDSFDGHWHAGDDQRVIEDVTHWQPMPEPPR